LQAAVDQIVNEEGKEDQAEPSDIRIDIEEQNEPVEVVMPD
jgi:hypothetical protein